MKLLAEERAKDFIRITDTGFDTEERDLLRDLIVSTMHQAFCYGYGIGKMEGITKKKICL